MARAPDHRVSAPGALRAARTRAAGLSAGGPHTRARWRARRLQLGLAAWRRPRAAVRLTTEAWEGHVVRPSVAGQTSGEQRRPAGRAGRAAGGGAAFFAAGLAARAAATDHDQPGMGLVAASVPADRGCRSRARLRR